MKFDLSVVVANWDILACGLLITLKYTIYTCAIEFLMVAASRNKPAFSVRSLSRRRHLQPHLPTKDSRPWPM